MPAPPVSAATLRPPHCSCQSRHAMFIHDPSMIREGRTWYLYSTGDPNGEVNDGDIQIRESTDLRTWRLVGTVFHTIPSWITNRITGRPKPAGHPTSPTTTGSTAPYCMPPPVLVPTTRWSNAGDQSRISLDPSSAEYHWKDDGLVFFSVVADNYNAIDPALISAPDGAKWLLFGSFWGGIHLASSRRGHQSARLGPPHPLLAV